MEQRAKLSHVVHPERWDRPSKGQTWKRLGQGEASCEYDVDDYLYPKERTAAREGLMLPALIYIAGCLDDSGQGAWRAAQ